MHFTLRRSVALVAAALLAACGGGDDREDAATDARSKLTSSQIAQVSKDAASKAVARLAIAGGAGINTTLDQRLAKVHGPVEVWVSMDEPSVAAFDGERRSVFGSSPQGRAFAKADAGLAAASRGQRARVFSQQDNVGGQLKSLGAEELGRVQLAHNAIAIKVDASQLRQIAALPGVAKVRPVGRYQLASSEAVPYVGATAVQAAGFDGRGVRVAVIDTGIDYTHYNLGGPGTGQAYGAAYASPAATNGLFPTAKVVGGWDFVGEVWPNGDRTEDPDPIDAEGHGTHVADIIAGRSNDGKHKGVAPGASLIALKVCSAVALLCDGVSMMKAMEYALDPNGDGDMRDAVDIINLSIGSAYGQEEDDMAFAAANAVKLGVVVVAAAGNSGNLPFSVSAPSTAPGVISVAQTETPDALAFPLQVEKPSSIAPMFTNTAVMGWAPLGNGFNGSVTYIGQGCPAVGATPADVYRANPSGKIVLVDRGGCSISLKIDRAARAGARGVIVGLVGPGDPVSFTLDGGSSFVPTVVITKAAADKIKARKAGSVVVRLNAAGQALTGSITTTSARGPSTVDAGIKPEIGAPGALVSAVAGSGSGTTPFSGTSGAAPMVAGAAALLLQANPGRSPEQIKAQLMNSAETKVYTSSVVQPLQLAPVSRVGSGELRVDRALALTSLAREKASMSASLSFGFVSITQTATYKRKLLVENFSNSAKVYKVKSSYRTIGSGDSGAVRLYVPSSVEVPARSSAEIEVKLVIDGAKLPDWSLDGGPNGGNGALLDLLEYDGYITVSAGSDKMTVPWHVLPRKSSAFAAIPTTVKAGQTVRLSNFGAAKGGFDVFSLTGVSSKVPNALLPAAGSNTAFVDLRATGVRLLKARDPAEDQVQFAVNTFGRRMHPNYPAEFDVKIDINRDGVDDFNVFNGEFGGYGASGQNIVHVIDYATGASTTYNYTDADMNSANAILTVPRSAIGLSRDAAFNFTVQAFDAYFTGFLTDEFGVMTYTLGKPRYVATDLPEDGKLAPFSAIRVGTAAPAGGTAASPSQTGLLFMYRQDAGREADTVTFK